MTELSETRAVKEWKRLNPRHKGDAWGNEHEETGATDPGNSSAKVGGLSRRCPGKVKSLNIRGEREIHA